MAVCALSTFAIPISASLLLNARFTSMCKCSKLRDALVENSRTYIVMYGQNKHAQLFTRSNLAPIEPRQQWILKRTIVAGATHNTYHTGLVSKCAVATNNVCSAYGTTTRRHSNIPIARSQSRELRHLHLCTNRRGRTRRHSVFMLVTYFLRHKEHGGSMTPVRNMSPH